MTIGGIIFIIISVIIREINLLLSISNIDLNLILLYLFLIFICAIIEYAEFYWLLKKTSTPKENTFTYVIPIVSIFLGGVILD